MTPQLSAEHYCVIRYDIGTMIPFCAVLERYTVAEYCVRRRSETTVHNPIRATETTQDNGIYSHLTIRIQI